MQFLGSRAVQRSKKLQNDAEGGQKPIIVNNDAYNAIEEI